MTIQSAQPRRGLVLLFRNGGRAQVTFHHVPLKALLRTLDAISSVHRLELFRHPPNHHEERNAGADGLVFYRLSYSELKTHNRTFLSHFLERFTPILARYP